MKRIIKNREVNRTVTMQKKRKEAGSADQEAPITLMRRAGIAIKSICVVVTVAFLGLYLQPLAMAAQLPSRQAPAPHVASNEEKLARTLEDIEQRLERYEQKLAKREAAAQEAEEVKALRKQLDDLDKTAIEDFDKIEKHLKDKKLPQVILDRHAEAVKTYKTEMATLKTNLDELDKAKNDEERGVKAKQAKEHLKAKQKKRGPKTKFDPNDLPNKSLQPNPKNKPKLTKDEFIRAGLHSNPYEKYAAHGNYNFAQLAGASDPAYLAATTEVTLTPAIQAKAAELEHNPVKIYNWVRNNVEWLPTWGATQDADVTLGSKRGNAMDIASLTIALLRASGIPARYVHGTIEVPADKFMNWAGGFTDIKAAGDYASSGGVPTTGMVSGGKIAKIQLEHVWVEAAIDFRPSRGAINKSADSWAQLDASYKQYQDLPGLDVVSISGIDPNALAQSFASSGTVNQTEGWVSGLNPAILQNAQTQAQVTLTNYINTNLPNATVGDVIGGRKIIAQTASVLPTALANRTVAVGVRYGTLPGALQNTMTLAFGIDFVGDPIGGVTFPWAKLNNHKVTLSFKPATLADEQTLASLLPPGPITDPSQLPSSIPSYLIYVKPEIAVDGQVVSQGGLMRLGEDLNFTYMVGQVGGIGNRTTSYAVPAGSYLSVAVTGGSVSPTKVDVLRTKLQQNKAKLESGDAAAIGALTREDIMGDMFYAGTLGYFGEYIALAHITSLAHQTRHNLPIGYGTIGYEPNVQSFFGFPRAINSGGVAVDMHLGWVIHSLDGDAAKRLRYSLQAGVLSSALEHGVPEQMFGTGQQPVQGVSAVKALQIAAKQGQRIYHITQANQAQVLPNLHLDGLAMSEISQALAAGKEVIAHTDRISAPGFTGEGYILFDSVTGGGAYKITGGSNGGFFADLDWKAVGMLLLGSLFAALSVFTIPVAIAALAAGLGVWAGAAAFLGIVFSILAVTLGFNPVLLVSARAVVATVLVFGLLAFGPALVLAPIAFSLFMMWVIAISALEITILLAISGDD